MLRFCYTLTNTGDEALNLHDVRDSHIGQIAGPGFDHLVQPGDGVALTATGAFGKSALHDVTWEATGHGIGHGRVRVRRCLRHRCSVRRSRST